MKTVVLFQPLYGYYDLVVRDLPLGLLAISRYIHRDYNVVIVDQRIKGWKKKLDRALTQRPVCFGVTSTTGKQIHYALEISKYVKGKSDIPVVWGGVHPTLMPEETLQNPYVDIILEGEGEHRFASLVHALDKGLELSGIEGIWYKDSDGVVRGRKKEGYLGLDELPFIPYQILDLREYKGYSIQNYGIIFNIETGRGCPNNCSFCYHSVADKAPWRMMSAERIIEEVLNLKRYINFKGINLVDDNFCADKDRVDRFRELLLKEKLGIVWGSETGIRELKRFSEEELGALEKSGLRWLSIGIESGSQRIMDEIQKGVSLEDADIINRHLAKFNIFPQYNFMCGYIDESKEELKETMSFILKILKDNPRASIQTLNIIVPYPKTRYAGLASHNGMVMPHDLEGWECFNPDDWIDYCPWLDRKEKNLLKTLYVGSLFIDRKVYLNVPQKTFYGNSVRFVYNLFHKLSKARFRTCSAVVPLEAVLFDVFKRICI
ncbi:MAG: radical SAM protein [Candidatus Omnitrophota bacterium]